MRQRESELPSTTIPAQVRTRVRALDQRCCAYCHTPEELTVTTFEVDHIVQVSAGGETQPDNLCLTCPSCNRHKRARQFVSIPEVEQVIALYHPRRQVWSAHFAWSDDDTQLVGLTLVGQATIQALHVNRPQMIRLRGMWLKLELFPPD